jgi:hypothetical protein
MRTEMEGARILGLGGTKTDAGSFVPEALLSIVEGRVIRRADPITTRACECIP